MDIKKIVENIRNIDYSLMDTDRFLDDRDSQEFDTEWSKIFWQIDAEEIPNEVKKQTEIYKKEVFHVIDELTGGSELSEYISEDIELLLYGDYLNIQSEWFKKFINKYENGELPTGIL